MAFLQRDSIIYVWLGSKCTSVACKEERKKLSYIKNVMAPLWTGFNCLKAAEPLRGDSLVFKTQPPGVPGTYLIDLRRWQDEFTLELFSSFEPWTLWLGIQCPNHYNNWEDVC